MGHPKPLPAFRNPKPFVFTVLTTGSPENFALPLISGGTYNFTVDWGDGTAVDTITAWNQAETTHTYASAGTQTITIRGTIRGWYCYLHASAIKLREIKSWGPLRIAAPVVGLYGQLAFHGCTGMTVTATDILDMHGTTSFNQTFRNCDLLTTVPSMNDWDMSNVTSLYACFYSDLAVSTFNQNIGDWDVSTTIDMRYIFGNCKQFNQNLGKWNTTKATDMSSMFIGCSVFNNGGSSDIGSWDTANVTTMTALFAGCTVFNQPVGNWNVSKVTSFLGMFMACSAFNQNLSGWNTESATNFQNMFQSAVAFNNGGDSGINNWNTANVTTMSYMFGDGLGLAFMAFNQPVGSWNISKNESMYAMFYRNSAFNQNIGSWDVSKVTDMRYTFCNSVFNNGGSSTIGNWVTSAVTSFFSTFNLCPFNQNIGGWDTSSVTDMSGMFGGNTVFNQNIGGWDTSKVASFASMFQGATSFNQNLGSNFVTSVATSLSSMFGGATAFNNGGSSDIGSWDTANVTTMYYLFGATAFNQNISGWDTSKNTTMWAMFYLCPFNQDISGWDVSKVTDMQYTFCNNTVFNQDIGGWDTGSVTTMFSMLAGATAFNQDISGWDIVDVTDMSNFLGATSFSTTNYDLLLVAWEAQSVKNGVVFGVGSTKYSAGAPATAHAALIADHSWSITDGGPV